MTAALHASIAANRFGLGAKPTELSAFAADPREALKAQLRRPSAFDAGSLQPSNVVLTQAMALREQRPRPASVAAVGGAAAATGGDVVKVAKQIRELYRPIYVDEALARFTSGVNTDSSFVERLVQFWSNHFAVSIDKVAVEGVAGAMEREAIRPNVLGNFRDLLLSVERHPAMLLYLDNHISIGPNSRVAQAAARRNTGRKLGLNENLGREILELHTLGVDAGYSQADVTSFAAMLTGWSIGGDAGRLRGGEPGSFFFRENFHEPGPKTLLGHSYREDGYAQGERALRDLALNPHTANHLATKLARHFIRDEPDPATVRTLAGAYLDSRGDLRSLYDALIDLPQAWTQPLGKFKTPSDYIYSAYRALSLPVAPVRRSLQPFEVLGQRTFQPGSPAGWPDRSADWDGSSALLKRLEWADAVGQRLGSSVDAIQLADATLGATLSRDTRRSVMRAQDSAQALTLWLSSPEFMRR